MFLVEDFRVDYFYHSRPAGDDVSVAIIIITAIASFRVPFAIEDFAEGAD